MSVRIKIERQVARLADSLTSEVVSRVMEKLSTQPKKDTFTGWGCRCIYCNLHGAYSLINRKISNSRVQDKSQATQIWAYSKDALKGGKNRLEALGLSHNLLNHINQAKHQIGVMPFDLLIYNYGKYMVYEEAIKLMNSAALFCRVSGETWGSPSKFHLEDMYE